MGKLNQLVRLRQQVERQSGKRAANIEIPLLHVLDDVCTAIGLSNRDKRKVLGKKGYIKLESDRDWSVTIK